MVYLRVAFSQKFPCRYRRSASVVCRPKFVLSFDLILCCCIFHQGLPSDSFSTENGVMVTRGSRY